MNTKRLTFLHRNLTQPFSQKDFLQVHNIFYSTFPRTFHFLSSPNVCVSMVMSAYLNIWLWEVGLRKNFDGGLVRYYYKTSRIIPLRPLCWFNICFVKTWIYAGMYEFSWWGTLEVTWPFPFYCWMNIHNWIRELQMGYVHVEIKWTYSFGAACIAQEWKIFFTWLLFWEPSMQYLFPYFTSSNI